MNIRDPKRRVPMSFDFIHSRDFAVFAWFAIILLIVALAAGWHWLERTFYFP